LKHKNSKTGYVAWSLSSRFESGVLPGAKVLSKSLIYIPFIFNFFVDYLILYYQLQGYVTLNEVQR
jgi:hypothetical protein